MLLPLLLPLLVADTLPQVGGTDPADIREADIRAHIGFLASDAMKGRASGSPEARIAAEYLAHQFAWVGAKPAGHDGSYFHDFEKRGEPYRNVAALVSGTDPTLAEEYLVIGAHYDHAGVGGPGALGGERIHNGADDNASGTAGVLELAAWFAAHPTPRPILFVCFTAEERGLWGSQAFVANPPVPREQIHAMLNLDMIGRSQDDYLFVGGTGTALEFEEFLPALFDATPLSIESSPRGEAPSDNTPFYKAGIPALFFFTGIHEDYHLPGDDAGKVAYGATVHILELVRTIAASINGSSARLTFEESPGMGMPAGFMRQMMGHYRHAQSLSEEDRAQTMRETEVREHRHD